MSTILRRLGRASGCSEFAELFDPARGVATLVVTFLALLELARERCSTSRKSESFAPIYVRLAHGRPH
jgi:segregation and condensation protein A